MEILVTRRIFQLKATIGDLTFPSNENNFLCNVLEDRDRNLNQTDSLEHINLVKVYGETAIPYGRYKLVLDWSDRFQCIMPHILDVPGFIGIRMHIGNTDKDTSGCQLMGMYEGGEDFIKDSGTCFATLIDILYRADDRNEEVWITIKKAV